MKKNAKKHSFKQVMAALKKNGSAQTRKTYARHGISSECYGVSYAFLKKFDKTVQDDIDLAEQLWDSGVHDARVFACWIAEEEAVTPKLLDRWSRDVDNHALGHELSWLAAYTRHGAGRAKAWRKLKDEHRSATGWSILSSLALQEDRPAKEGGVTDEELETCLAEIEKKIHDAPNACKAKMNNALISIGCRTTMTKKALAVAKRVGKVEVDHGDTSCKTNPAAATIEKTIEHYKKKGQRPCDGAGGKRRRHC